MRKKLFSLFLLSVWGAVAAGATEQGEQKKVLPRDPRRDVLKNKNVDPSIRIVDEVAFFGQMDLTRVELQNVRKAVDKKDWSAAKIAWAKHLDERKNPQWLWSWRDREKIKKFLTEKGKNISRHVGPANKVLQRDFDFQGVHRKLDRNIDWEANEYEYEWCNVLNRHEYWRTLGFAWWQTGDAKYVEDWLFMLRDWLADNPAGKGQPWRSLEVGIRASHWFDILYTFMDAPGFDASLKYEMTRSLVEHAHFLYKNNAKFKKGNWQTAECTGLACVGIMLPEFKESKEWRARSFEKMQEHMREGVYTDGAQYELTPGYHTWVLMEFLHLQKLAAKNGYTIQGLAERHEKMFEFLMQISTPDQRFMSHGDAGGRAGRSIKDSMALGALLYARPDMRYLANDKVNPDWIWLFSPEELAAYDKRPSQEPKGRSHLLPNAQYGIMRTGWKKEDRWLFFDCGPYGGNHSHSDQLQVLLYSGRDLILDEGQISYDQPLSKSYYKSAQAHNGLLVNEQGPESKIKPEVVTWCVKDRTEFVAGRITYNNTVHQRSVLFVKPAYWVVVDHVRGTGTQSLTRLFHLPKVDITKDVHTVKTCFKNGDNLSIQACDNGVLEMRETPSKTSVAAFVTQQPLPAILCTVFVPFGDQKQIPKVERLPVVDSDVVELRVTFSDGRTDWISVASEERKLKAGEHTGKGVALWASRDSKGTVIERVVIL